MITRNSRRTVYENRWMKVHEDGVRFGDGSEGIYGVVDKPDFVLIVPRSSDGRLHLVEQFRYPVGERFWEFPQGSWETQSSTDPTAVAMGELREETGLTAGHLTRLGYLCGAYGFCNQGCHVFLATDLSTGQAERERSEQDMISKALPAKDIPTLIETGRLVDGPSIAALTLLQMHDARIC